MPGQTIPILRGSTGLRTKVDPVRLKPDDQTFRPLCTAVNVIVDNSGRINRREGYTLVSAGDTHSLWSSMTECYCVRANVLCSVSSALGLTPLTSITPGQRVAYCRFGSRVYWTTEKENGYIENGVNHTWSLGVNTTPNISREYFGPPCGHLLAEINSRLYMASGNGVYISERGDPHLWWYAGRTLRFASKVTLLAGVSDGVWVSDCYGLYFITGLDPEEQIMSKKADFPAVLGQAVAVNADWFNYDNLKQMGSGAIWKVGTSEGLLTLGTGGFFHNETRHAIEYDKPPFILSAPSGTAGIIGDHAVFLYEGA